MKKRLVSMALAAAMAVSVVPVSFAEVSGGEDVSEDVLIEEIQTPEPEGPAEDAAEEAEVSADEAETEPLVTDEPEEIPEETAVPEEPAAEEELTLYENMDVELFATGTYYEEYGIWFDTSSGTITDADEGLEGDLYIPESIDGVTVTSIGNSAFSGCTGLTGVDIPDTVTSIGINAYRGCSRLSKVKLPNNLEILECDAFRDCGLLTEIEIPKSLKNATGTSGRGPFYNSGLKKVTFEERTTQVVANLFSGAHTLEEAVLIDTMMSINTYAFNDCPSLKDIVIPDNVTNIDTYAFSGCNNLSSVKLPKSLEILGYDAFRDCSSLTEIEIPKSVIYATGLNGRGPFYNSGLKKATFEEGTTYAAANLFSGAFNLEEAVLLDTMTSIGDDTFRNCLSLKNVVIPNHVETIKSGAYRECSNLSSITLPESLTSIHNTAFSNCPNLTIYCSEYMPAITTLIDNGIQFVMQKEITSYENFVFANTDYTSSINQMTGYVPFEIKYETAVYGLTDKKLVVRIPSSSELVESTLMFDGVLLTDYEYKNGLLTVPAEPEKATLTFCVKPTQYTTLLTYARMDMQKNGAAVSEMIGVLNCSVPDISIKTDSVTNDGTVTVEGIAPPSSNVDIYVGDELVGSAASVKSGNYSAEISIPSPVNYNKYTITARSQKDSGQVEASAEVAYQDAVPTLSSLYMYYTDHYKTHKYELSNQPVKPIIVYNPSCGLKFEAYFDNVENVDKVYIVSTRNNQKKYMDAAWDETKGCFVAEGQFEGTNSSYVPGEITVEYTKKRKEVPISSTIDTDTMLGYMDDAVKDCVTNVTENTDTSYKASISVAEELTGLLGDEINMAVETIDREYSGIPITDLIKDGENFYSYFIDEGSDKYVLNIDLTDSEQINMIVHDIAGNKQLSYTLDFMDNSTPGNPSKALKVSEVLSAVGTVTGIIADVYDIETSDDELRQRIYASGMSAEEQAIALKKADELKTNRQLFLLLTTGVTIATMGMGGPSAVVLGLLYGAVTASSSFFWDMHMANILSGGIEWSPTWITDPSGYVYEAVTTNRIEGVTASAYWIAPAYIDENGKGDTSKAVLWDASEYAQINPLVTDMNGAYAWDVPEGLWQVRFEKDGYEPQSSEWLPVPPPQTEVNIGLVSKAVPKVESAALTDDRLTITFDKYMKPDTVKDVAIDGYTYTMDYNKNETAPDGTVYAREYVFKLNRAVPEGEEIDVSVSGAESYAGVMMQSYSGTVTSAVQESVRTVSIENAAAENGTVTADFVNLTDDYGSFEAVCAVYDKNGALVGVKTGAVVALDGGARTKKTFVFDEEWESCKLFAWDSTETMNALAVAAGV